MVYGIKLRSLVTTILAAAFAGGCATIDTLPPAQVSDPLEPANRAVYALNNGFNTVVTFPLTKGYETIVPPPARQAVAAGISNLNEPTVFANNILQGRFSSALITLERFIVNSTIGVGGLVDVAALGGLPKQTGDFGQTLFVWGWRDSPFIMMPLLGPATIRDGIGFGVDSAASPGMYAVFRVGGRVPPAAIGGFDGLRRAKDLQTVDETAVDPYARLRSVYYQNRRQELLDGIGRKGEAFDPMLDDGGVRRVEAPMPPRAPGRR